MTELEKVNITASFLNYEGFLSPDTAIILGTGLGDFINHIHLIKSINYNEIPNFPEATVEQHKGVLYFANYFDKNLIVMNGRFHYYEGHTMNEIVFSIRVFATLGVKRIIILNAGGLINQSWKKGELMISDDHINLLPDNPLRDKEAKTFGPIFVDMSRPYSDSMNNTLIEIALKKNIILRKGIYVSVEGPSLETRAEYRYLRMIGADVVGMSTVPEVIAANQLNIPVTTLTVFTDECDPNDLKPVDIRDIIQTAKGAEKNIIVLLKEFLKMDFSDH